MTTTIATTPVPIAVTMTIAIAIYIAVAIVVAMGSDCIVAAVAPDQVARCPVPQLLSSPPSQFGGNTNEYVSGSIHVHFKIVRKIKSKFVLSTYVNISGSSPPHVIFWRMAPSNIAT